MGGPSPPSAKEDMPCEAPVLSKRGSTRAGIENVLSVLLAVFAIYLTAVSREHLYDNCLPSSKYCKIHLGSAGTVSLPAVLAFRTGHGTFLKVLPAEGI